MKKLDSIIEFETVYRIFRKERTFFLKNETEFVQAFKIRFQNIFSFSINKCDAVLV